MNNRIDAIYVRQSIDKKDSISTESQFEFCRCELKGGEGKEYKDKDYSSRTLTAPIFSDFRRHQGRAAYGFDLEPIVMDRIKTKKLVENAEMDYIEMMFEMYAETETSYGDITRYFTIQDILVYWKALKRGFCGQLLRNLVYVQADMDIYEYFKTQGVKI